MHYITLNSESQEKLRDDSREALNQPLAYGEEHKSVQAEEDEENTTFFITPRIGTISPWSPKTTSIAWVCGFDKIIKWIEKGTIITIVGLKEAAQSIAYLLHDPMTETISAQIPDLPIMFAESSPASLKIVDLGDNRDSPKSIK